jgi:hypothetical protein
MSVKSLPIQTLFGLRQKEISVLRYSLGAGIVVAIAMGFAWELSFLLPVLSLGFFAPGAKCPSFRQGLVFVSTIVIASIMSLVFCVFFLDYMLIYLPGLALLFLHLFYTDNLNPLLKTWLLISFLIIPMLGLQSMQVAYFISLSLIINAIITMLVVWFLFALMPDRSSPENRNESKKKESVSTGPSRKKKLLLALERLIVVFPVVLFFFFFQWSGAILVLVFIAILSMQPGFASNFKAGLALIAGNIIGGISAILVYELLVIVPEYYFLIILVFLAGLVFSKKLFSGKPTAPIFGMAFSTLLLIIGQSTSGTEDAGGKVWLRVIQILGAVVYVVFAFGLIEHFKEQKRTKQTKKEAKKQTMESSVV